MDDQQLDLALAAMGSQRMAVADPPALHERVMTVPLLLGSFLLAGVLTTPLGDDVVPAAPSDGPSDITYVEMTLNGGIVLAPPSLDESDGLRSRGAEYEFVYETDDPRISGTFTMTQNIDGDVVGASLQWGEMRIENDDGSWRGPFTEIGRSATGDTPPVRTASPRGDGDYEGYTLFLQLSAPRQDGTSHAQGVIYKGQLP